MAGDLKARPEGQIMGNPLQDIEIRINDLFAFGADQMRMRVRPGPVIAVPSFGKTQLQDLMKLFKKVYGLINRCQAGGGKIFENLLIDALHTGMSTAGCEDTQDSNPLRGNLKMSLPQLFQHKVHTIFDLRHIISNNRNYQLIIIFGQGLSGCQVKNGKITGKNAFADTWMVSEAHSEGKNPLPGTPENEFSAKNKAWSASTPVN